MKHTCKKCGYVWESKKENFMPRTCPRCKSPKWSGAWVKRETDKTTLTAE
jgi:predicted Zn-ribbon and HTH transcriptional regulator